MRSLTPEQSSGDREAACNALAVPVHPLKRYSIPIKGRAHRLFPIFAVGRILSLLEFLFDIGLSFFFLVPGLLKPVIPGNAFLPALQEFIEIALLVIRRLMIDNFAGGGIDPDGSFAHGAFYFKQAHGCLR